MTAKSQNISTGTISGGIRSLHQLPFLLRIALSLLILILFTLAVFYILTTRNDYRQEAIDRSLGLAEAAAAFIEAEPVSRLDGHASDLSKPDYQVIKSQLTMLRQKHNQIRFAYLYRLQDSQVILLADSEPVDSPDYSPPGQAYSEADPILISAFVDSTAKVTRPVTDRWGTWVSVLVPVLDPESQKAVAVLGLDYPAAEWSREMNKHMLHAIIIVACFALLICTLLFLALKNRQLSMLGHNLRESERSKSVLLAHLPGMAYRCLYDRNWTMQFVSAGCKELTGYEQSSLLGNRELSYNDIITPEYRELLWCEWERVLALRIPFRYEYEILTGDGSRKWVLEMGQGIENSEGQIEALEGIIIDITESRQREARIRYLNDHDFLTGLYNHSYFEAQKEQLAASRKLPLSIIIGDINGVRLINDAFGHAEGDRLIIDTARLIQSCCRPGDILARTGGDEFSILLPETDAKSTGRIMEGIMATLDQYNREHRAATCQINLSLGYGTMTSDNESMAMIARQAEEYMHRRKLLNRRSYHNAVLSSIMATLYARSQETEDHARRLAALSKMVGLRLNLSQKTLDELELFAMLHDIGKVGIDDKILNKPGPLSSEEWIVMKQHPEYGCRIAMSASEFEGVGEYILTHHERWDGQGYPQGLKGQEIPLLSRILAIADAYDAMTENRVYRRAMTQQDAIAEIVNNSGTQFDPELVPLFVESIRQEMKQNSTDIPEKRDGGSY